MIKTPPRPYVYWGDQLKVTAPDTSTLTIESERVDRDHCFRASIINIVDETTTAKTLEIGVKNGSEYSPIVKRAAGSNNYSLAPNVKGLVLKEGEQLYGKVYSPTAGDVCVLIFSGELYLRE